MPFSVLTVEIKNLKKAGPIWEAPHALGRRDVAPPWSHLSLVYSPFPQSFPEADRQVDDDDHVGSQDERGNPTRMREEMAKLQRNVERGPRATQPLRPTPPHPETVRFEKPDDRVESGATRQQPDFRIVEAFSQFQEDLRRVVRRIQVKMVHEPFHGVAGAMLQKTGKAEADEQNQQSLGGFE